MSEHPLTIMLVAAEASGDALGAGKGQNGQGDPVNGGGADGNE